MRRRFSSLAIVIVAALAVRAAYWPTFLCRYDSQCEHGAPASLADHGMHIPAAVVLFFAALDLFASFAPPASALPRAWTGRREPTWIPLASPARALLESDVAVTLRSLGWVASFLLATLAFLTYGHGGGSDLACASHVLLALLVVLRLPPKSPYGAW